jgi:glycosyltransferase involved in cell wall biosynthesis
MFLIESMHSRGGMERVTAIVASGLARRGLDVQILTLRGRESAFPLAPEVRLTTLGLPPGTLRMRAQTWPLIRGLRRRFRADRPDVLIVVDTFLCAFAFPAALGLRARRVAWEHFHFYTDLGMRSRRFGRWAAAFLGRHVVTLTQQDVQQWTQAFPAALARIRSIANPLSFAPPSLNPYLAANRTVLAVGRLDDQKGFDLLLDSWAMIEPEFPEWSLKILGSGTREQGLRQQAARLKLKRWSLEGATSQIEQEYRAAGVYALSSRHEGLPMVLMESQAYGVPAVAFNCPTGPADLLGPGGGLLVEAGSTFAFAAALRRVMSDSQLRQDMSQQAFENSARYEAGRILDQWTAFLEVFRPKPSPVLGQQNQGTSVPS